MTEDDLKEKAKLEAMGQLVVNNEAFKRAVKQRKDELFDTFTSTRADQTEEREEAWRTMQNLNALLDYFETILIDGKMAREQLNKLHSRTNRD